MSIKVGNIRTHKKDGSVAIKIDRSSVLGNPFYMADESKRDLVCDQYEEYFNKKVRDGTDLEFIKELNRIWEISRTQDVTLLCWCSPKRCHGERIKKCIENRIK